MVYRLGAVYGTGHAPAPPAPMPPACYTPPAYKPHRKQNMHPTSDHRRTALKALLAAFAMVVLSPTVDVTPAEAQVQRQNPTLVHARGLVQRGRYREAIPVLRKFLQTYQSNLEAWTLLGRSYRGTGNFRAAVNATNQALRFSPNHPPAIENLGMIYLESNRIDGAEQQLARLRRVCRFGCRSRDRLERAIAQAKSRRSGSGSGRSLLVPGN